MISTPSHLLLSLAGRVQRCPLALASGRCCDRLKALGLQRAHGIDACRADIVGFVLETIAWSMFAQQSGTCGSMEHAHEVTHVADRKAIQRRELR